MGSKYSLAIVTGGSSGIGKSIIDDFSKLEPDALIINLSRQAPASFYNNTTRLHLSCDLGDKGQRTKAFDQLERHLRNGQDTGGILLVNNSGFAAYGSIESIPPAKHLELLEVNVCALVELTARLLPYIVKRGGDIVTIASTAAFQPTPNLATYGASKGFVLNWTLALNEELRGTGSRAIAICPGPTRTDFFRRAGMSEGGSSGHRHSPEQVSQLAFRALARRKAFTVTGRLNKLLTLASGLLPLALRARAAGSVMRRFRKTSQPR